MNIIHQANELGARNRPVCLCIGFFDGVHLGHQHIIRQTIEDARQQDDPALVVTFDRHPNTIVAPARVPPLIYPLNCKLEVIEALGADTLLLLHFEKSLSDQPAEVFIRKLAADLGQIRSICVGVNFTFGRKRGGNLALLQQLGREIGFKVHGMAAVSLDGEIISSTRIRHLIRSGQLDLASQMLGRAYSLSGIVVRGDGLGRQLGFPTANLDATGLALPPNGVYAARAIWRKQPYRAVLNIGFRPTLGNPNPTLRIEAHLLHANPDLYDQPLEVVPIQKLRDEVKFNSLEELKRQISRDIESAAKRF